MAELHIDTDWKKQAQEEKRKLAEEAAKTTAAPAPEAPVAHSSPGQAQTAAAGRPTRGNSRELPPASFPTLVQTIVTQALYYLGDLSLRGGEASVNLDLAKHQIDLLGILEDKTKGNLSADEQKLLDAALYESRMRYVSVASQYLG